MTVTHLYGDISLRDNKNEHVTIRTESPNHTIDFITTNLLHNGVAITPGTNKGTVIQNISVTTGVILNTPAGKITTFSQSATTHTTSTFTVTNSTVAATSIVLVNIMDYGGSSVITASVHNIVSGSFKIVVGNAGSVNLDAVAIIGFTVV